MKAKFTFEMDTQTGAVGGESKISNCGLTEAAAFLATAMVKILSDVHALAKKEGLEEKKAAGLVLEICKCAMENYAEKVGKDTMLAAYELNSRFEAERTK